MIDLAAKPFYLKPEDIEWVNKTLAGMTTEEKAGQLFCVLFKECKPEEFEYVFNILKPGGCMYRVVPTERAIAATQNIYSRSKVPPLIAANLEKGGNGIVTEGTLVGAPMEIAATDDTGNIWYTWEVLGYPFSLVDAYTLGQLEQRDDVQAMPAFPAQDCCQMIDGTLVVKLSAI